MQGAIAGAIVGALFAVALVVFGGEAMRANLVAVFLGAPALIVAFAAIGALFGRAKLFKPKTQGVWELVLKEPVQGLEKATLHVSVKDRQGNVSLIERTFSVVSREKWAHRRCLRPPAGRRPAPSGAVTVRAVWLADLTPDLGRSGIVGRFVFVPDNRPDGVKAFGSSSAPDTRAR